MLPGPLIGIYQGYKRDTDAVASWLASTARANGYSSDLLTSLATASQPQLTSKRLKGKARKEAKKATPSKLSPPVATSPQYVVAIKDFLPLAQFIAAKPCALVPRSFIDTIDRVITVRSGFGEQLDDHGADPSSAADDAKHQFFIGILEGVRDALKPRAAPRAAPLPSDTSASAPTATSATSVSAGSLENRYAALDIYEPSQAFLDAPDIERPQNAPGDDVIYAAEPQNSLHDATVAYTMMMNDLMKIRSRINWIWTSHRDGFFDIAAAAIAANTAIDLARHLVDDITPLFKEHGGTWKMTHIFYHMCCLQKGFTLQDLSPANQEDNFNYDTYEVADETYLNAHRILLSFQAVLNPSCLPLYKDGMFGRYYPESDRSAKSGRLKFQEDQVLLMEFFTELMTIIRTIPKYPVQDEFLRGMKEMDKTGEISFSLVFSAQVYLDIHHVLREKAVNGLEALHNQAGLMHLHLEQHLEFHQTLTISNWPASNDHMLRELQKKITWILKDPIFQSKSKVYRRQGTPIPDTMKPHRILERSPIISGLVLYHLRAEMYDVGIAVANAWGSIMYSAHLYIALQREKLLVGQWEDMDIAMTLLRESSFWVGGRPGNPREYLERFCIQMGVSVAALKSRNRRNKFSVASRSGPRGIKPGIPVSVMFEDRYLRNTQQVDWTPEHVDEIISRSEFEQIGSENDGTLQMAQVDEPEKPRGKKKARRKAVDGAVLAPEQLIRALTLGLQSEVMEITFPYLFMHRWCWNLLRAVKVSCDGLLRTQYGPGYMENESELPFVVGYILLAASGLDGSPDDRLMKAASLSLNELMTDDGSRFVRNMMKNIYGHRVEFREDSSS